MSESTETARPDRSTATRELLIILVVLALLVLPGLRSTFGGWRANLSDELRPPAPFPAILGPGSFAREFEAFFDDRFGFRRELIRLHNRLKVDLLRTSPLERVLLGRDGWFYLRIPVHDRGPNGGIRHRQGTPLLTPREANSWRRMLASRDGELARRGIHYLFVVAPDKHSIYPEHLPDSVSMRPRSALDQLAPGLDADGVALLDLRPALRAAKPSGSLYWRTGTHWTDLGAKVVDDAIVHALARWFDDLNPQPLAAHRLSFHSGEGHGLARMLHLGDHYREATPELTRPSPPLAVQLDDAAILAELARDGRADSPLRDLPIQVFETNDPSLPRAVVVVDSFGEALRPFLVEHFERTVLVHRLVHPELLLPLIDWQQPDVVINEIVERNLRGKAVFP